MRRKSSFLKALNGDMWPPLMSYPGDLQTLDLLRATLMGIWLRFIEFSEKS